MAIFFLRLDKRLRYSNTDWLSHRRVFNVLLSAWALKNKRSLASYPFHARWSPSNFGIPANASYIRTPYLLHSGVHKSNSVCDFP